MQDLAGRTFVVTGATAGIGRTTALALARRGATVALVARDEGRLSAVAREIEAGAGELAPTFAADLSLVEHNHRVAEQIRSTLGTVDVLVNNVGAVFPEYGTTAEGIERTLALDHLGPFALTTALLPALRDAESPRVVAVSSQVHADRLDWTAFDGPDGYDPLAAYRQAKLLNLLLVAELHARYGEWLTSAGLHPGVVETGLLRDYDRAASMTAAAEQDARDATRGSARRLVGRIARNVLGAGVVRTTGISVTAGCATSVFAATAPEVEQHRGRYWRERRVADPAPIVADAATARDAWDRSRAIVDAVVARFPAEA